MRLHSLALASLLALSSVAVAGCGEEPTDSQSNDVGDAKNSKVERQAIGNCWLYATASWAEGLHIWATGEEPDISQSYWTFWHWYGEILDGAAWTEISTGGNTWTAHDIIRERGLMMEADFVPEDATSEMSSRQSAALSKINEEIKNGRLKESRARSDEQLVLTVLMDAWRLSPEVREQIVQVFGDDGAKTLAYGGDTAGTKIIAARDFAVAYPERETDPEVPTIRETNLEEAMGEWRTVRYPSGDQARREFQIRVQKTIHDGVAAVVTWDVDFNAMESSPGDKQGSFNMETRGRRGPGSQGGHMTVFEDYEVITKDFGVLEAGVTLDPSIPEDKAKLDAALDLSSEVVFFRIKNSWGGFRDDRSSAPGFPGYHDLYMDYLNGPLTGWCPSVTGAKTEQNCRGTSTPLRDVLLPPGY
jgi:hypothetical protein